MMRKICFLCLIGLLSGCSDMPNTYDPYIMREGADLQVDFAPEFYFGDLVTINRQSKNVNIRYIRDKAYIVIDIKRYDWHWYYLCMHKSTKVWLEQENIMLVQEGEWDVP